MTSASHHRPASITRVLADLHVDEWILDRGSPDQRVYVTLVPPQGGRLDVVRTRHRKWWLEGSYADQAIRMPLTLRQAAEIAACSFVESWCVYRPGTTGGEKLDKMVQDIGLTDAAVWPSGQVRGVDRSEFTE